MARHQRDTADLIERGLAETRPLLASGSGATPPSDEIPHPAMTTADPVYAIRTILFSGYINILLLFLPFAITSGVLNWSPNIVFLTNFFAMMPLAALMSFSTEELSKRVGQGLGGLLNVTFGNATELIVGIIALKEGQVKLIQSAMLGSILSSLLFVIPLAIIAYMSGPRIVFCSGRNTAVGIQFQ